MSQTPFPVTIQREDGKGMEIDIVANSDCGRVILVEVKKTQDKTGLTAVNNFQEKVVVYGKLFAEKTILSAYLSLGGFSKDAQQFCDAQNIATAERIKCF